MKDSQSGNSGYVLVLVDQTPSLTQLLAPVFVSQDIQELMEFVEYAPQVKHLLLLAVSPVLQINN